ncbi:MAG: sigma-54-dependent transcriptional regulator [Spirochaetaceae bacterium]
MTRILVVDDEAGIREVLQEILEDEGYDVFTAEDGMEAVNALKTEPIDLVILDVWLPQKGGIEVLEEIKETYVDMPVIVISGHGSIDVAVKAVKMGAFDFLEKPLSLEKVVTLVRNALELQKLRQENRELRNSLQPRLQMIGRSRRLEEIRGIIDQAAETDSTILITGENGTGKELVAREIHRKSRRAAGPFVEVNCAAIPDSLIESELFGHEKGAFTSAVSRRRGKFELADHGTLFLDEVADMSLSAQAKMLRVIQEMKFERIGGEENITVDVRLVAATNKDILAEIDAGNFREDLYYRVNVVTIPVPPLRERVEDLPLLVEHFLRQHEEEGQPPKRFTEEAMQALADYDWPGNIRELKNFVERITILSEGEEIDADEVHRNLGEASRSKRRSSELGEYLDMGLNEAKDTFERRYIEEKLQENGHNISRTAQALGIYPSNLHGKIRKLGIDVKK